MRTTMNASGLMPEYTYMPLPDGKADVFIFRLISQNDDGYEYEFNEFRTSKFTESDISRNPFAYLDYEESEKGIEEKLSELEAQNEMLTECLMELADIIYT